MTMRAIRGATSVGSDQASELYERTTELVEQMLSANAIDTDALVSAWFTCTPDITSAFPATAARAMGLGDVPLMCSVEMDVDGAPERIIRVMIHADMDVPRSQVRHVYLHEATSLRKDIAQ